MRKKLEQSACSIVGLWEQESSASDKDGERDCVWKSQEQVSVDKLRHGYWLTRAVSLFLVPLLFISLLFSPWT